MNIRILVLLPFLVLTALLTEARAETDLNFSQAYLSKVMGHLYRWHLDESALLAIDEVPEIEFLVRPLTPKLDEGDRSQFCEMLVPQLSYLLILKKAEYAVSELSDPIHNSEFRIVRAEKYGTPPLPRESYTTLRMPKKALLQHLFNTRNIVEFPDEVMIERMRKALRDQLGELASEQMAKLERSKEHTFYFAPISPISNDLWVFWETGGKIFRFSSDTDLNSKAYWDYEKLGIHIYDLKTYVVVSLTETVGSNAFVTRDWASRVLYNCVVHGRRLLITVESDLKQSVKIKEAPVTAH